MSDSGKFVLHCDVVRAIRWWTNLQEIIEFCKPYKVQVDLGIDTSNHFLEVMKGDENEWLQLMREQWLVKDKDGELSVVDWSEFNNLYREVD